MKLGHIVYRADDEENNIQIFNNIIQSTHGGYGMVATGVQNIYFTATNNIFFQNEKGDYLLTDSEDDTIKDTNLFQDAKLFDPKNEDFQLLFGSPAINSGTSTVFDYDIFTDYQDTPRDSNPDIGAYEYDFVGLTKQTKVLRAF